MKKTKRSGVVSNVKPAAALLGGSAAIFLIGFFQFLTEVSAQFKAFINIYPPVGPLSGKILLSYVLGIIAYYITLRAMRKSGEPDIMKYFILLIIAIVIGSVLSLTPVTDIIMEIGGLT